MSTNKLITPHSLLSGLVDLLYPPCCLFCEQGLPAGSQSRFCASCLAKLHQPQADQCPRCAASYPIKQFIVNGCPLCRQEKYSFAQTVAFGKYDGVLRETILRMKRLPGETLGGFVTELFAAEKGGQLSEWNCDAVVPVPLHWTRRFWRGYNQAAVIARVLAGKLGKPYRGSWLWRYRQTPMQTQVSPTERRHNLRQAFRARLPANHKGCRVLLVDDVMTTGSTADACAKALVRSGAGAVYLAVLARAIG
jgi:ComF family protein